LLPACCRNIIIKCFDEEVNKNCKVDESAVCFLYNIDVIFIVEVYTVFFQKKWVAVKRAGCWVAVKRTAGCCY